MICAIDANELFSLGLLLDELFGEKNRVGLVTVEHNPKGRNLSKFFSENSEFMLIYTKDIRLAKFNDVAIDEDKKTSFNLEDAKGRYRLEPFMRVRTSWSRKNKPQNYYPIYVSKDLKTITLEKREGYYEVYPKTADGREWGWKNIPKTFEKLNKDGYFVAKKEGNQIKIFHKYREKQVFKNIWINKKYHSEFHGTNLLKKILGENLFEYPKSLYLLEDILKITSKKNSIILDFFAGSGTTGHAVLELNKEDGGNRKFILVTNNENNICTDVCYPRIEKVIKGYKNLRGEWVEGLGGNLKYFKTDFVDAEPTDLNKKKLVDKSTEMLCLKEDCFDLVKEAKHFRIFKNPQGKHLGIIYDDEGIEPFKKEVKKLKKKFVVYVFSLDESAREEEFEDVIEMVELKPIPAVILNVYRRIFK
ncbi:site-specific DNA-methyltransferase [Thermotomaculum hydrothermale]|uniref:site-specific DNA-methyltransferase n=1 Tax=Thermotomaculum hydrothermale TaxID=981385 RepID=UPI001915DACC|nr:DNA methyltransferase [Thermotomaculum hydrothermale]